MANKLASNKCDIVVIGASAGGVTALQELVGHIPVNFTGSIFVVLHIPPHSPSNLPSILTRAGNLRAVHPQNGDKVERGMIYIAPPDHHMILHKDEILVTKGPKENRFRPSIDALFRSAAYTYGKRVTGIVLSGVLNDGTSGLWSVKHLGGIAVIQDPAEAAHPEMPLNVLEYVKVNKQLPVKQIAAYIVTNLEKSISAGKVGSMRQRELIEIEIKIAMRNNAFEMGIISHGELTPFTCPECNGVLVQILEGKLVRFRCHTGHAYTASALLGDLTESIEAKMWFCLRGLEETTMLMTKISEHFANIHEVNAARLFAQKASITKKKARVLQQSIMYQEVVSEDLRYIDD